MNRAGSSAGTLTNNARFVHGMAVDGLLAVGGILSLTLGISGLILARNQKLEVIWNKRFAAQILCWMFICKGVANSLYSVGYDT
ncbi:MAG: hypothetical protein ACPF92_08155, partial [Candidatus Poseidoniaceae archaeon]